MRRLWSSPELLLLPPEAQSPPSLGLHSIARFSSAANFNSITGDLTFTPKCIYSCPHQLLKSSWSRKEKGIHFIFPCSLYISSLLVSGLSTLERDCRCLQSIKKITKPANKQSFYGFCASLVSPDSQYGIRREVCRQHPQQRVCGQQAGALTGPAGQKAAELWAVATSHLLLQQVPGCLDGDGGLHTRICSYCVQHF